MMNERNSLSNYVLCLSLTLIILVPMTAGCSFFKDWTAKGANDSTQPKDSVADAASPETVENIPAPAPAIPEEPALLVAGDTNLTLFGEFQERSRIPFQNRPVSPMKQHTFTAEGADFDLDISPDGKRLVFSSTRHTTEPNLYMKTIEGRAVTQLTSDPAADVQPCFSPDGKKILFASYRSGNWDIWMMSLDGGQAIQITDSAKHEIHPSFAPDGQRLVYCVFNEKSEQWELWTQHLNLPASKKVIGVGLFPEWSPMADSIVYQKARERGGRWFSIWRIDLLHGEPSFPVEIAASTEMAYIQPSWSPDGSWITYGTAEIGDTSEWPDGGPTMMTRGDIWVVKADGTQPLKLTDGGGVNFSPVWSVDSRVYFTSLQNGSENSWSVKPLLVQMTQMPTASNDNADGIASQNGYSRTSEPNKGG